MHGDETAQGERGIISPLVLSLFLCADVAFFLLHGVNRLSASRNDLYSLSVDGGYAEVFQYLKEYWIAIALFAICWRRREGIYGAWAFLFTYFLLDDALTIHESAGRVVAAYWPQVQSLAFRAQDFGELTVSALAGAAFVALIASCYVRASERGRDVSKDLILLVGLLVFFGVFIDTVHIALESLQIRALTILEDGGEMVAMSVTASYVVQLVEERTHDAGQLWRLAVPPTFLTSAWTTSTTSAHASRHVRFARKNGHTSRT